MSGWAIGRPSSPGSSRSAESRSTFSSPSSAQAGLFVLIYHLPLYFQSLRNDTPLHSGASNLPYLTGGIFSMVSGFAFSATNQLIPFLAISAALSAVGSGLTYTFITNTLIDKWVGYQGNELNESLPF
ncbi:hypothetical protein ColTof4_09456 [Colletotrichum tofieldiae]|nr:hypothetical protein ColTof4_09456 [Colletotrichum tofieldiae]